MNRRVTWGSTLGLGLVWTRNLARSLFKRNNRPLLMISVPIILGIGGLVASLALFCRVQIEVASEREQRHEEDNYDDNAAIDLPTPFSILTDDELEPQREALLQERLRNQTSLGREEPIQYYAIDAERSVQAELDREFEIERHVIEASLRLEHVDLGISWHRPLQTRPLLPPESSRDDDGNNQYGGEGNDESTNQDDVSPQRRSAAVIEEMTSMLRTEGRVPQDISFVDPDNEECLITFRVTPTDDPHFWARQQFGRL